MEILLYTGLRRSDAVRIGWRHIIDDRIEIVASKTGVDLSIPIHDELWRFLKERPAYRPDLYHYCLWRAAFREGVYRLHKRGGA